MKAKWKGSKELVNDWNEGWRKRKNSLREGKGIFMDQANKSLFKDSIYERIDSGEKD
jgi:hypothetical protein